MQYESERIEYKSRMSDDIYKAVIAFANTGGGVLYLGADDQGNPAGSGDVDETYTRLTNGIRDAIAPDVTMFVRYVLQGKRSHPRRSWRGQLQALLSEIKGHKAQRRICSPGGVQRAGVPRPDPPHDQGLRWGRI